MSRLATAAARVAAPRQATREVRDPETGVLVGTVRNADDEAIEAALERAYGCRDAAAHLPAHTKTSALLAVSEAVRRDAEDFAKLIASEGIKTIREARLEVARCQDTLTLGAEEAKRLTGETVRFDQSSKAAGRSGWWSRKPIGVVVALTPYNDPLNLVAHKIAPAVAAGAPIIVKPHPRTPLSALRLVELFADQELPEGMVQILTGGASVGTKLVADHRPALISLSGSRAAGEAIAKIAGLKRLCMELGGVGVATVAADADLEKASAALVSGAFWAAGQNCVHTQRIIVQRQVFEPLKRLMVERTRTLRVGSKHDPDTDVGPMLEEAQAVRLEALIADATNAGAEVLAGGSRSGNLFMPTLLSGVPDDHPLLIDEIFGPVAILETVDRAEQALERMALSGPMINASLFTNRLDLMLLWERFADAGTIVVNDSTDFRIDAMPFGGNGAAGLGREGIRFAVEALTEPKLVCLASVCAA